MKLSFVLAESALELVPREIWKAPAVVSDSRRRGIEPSGILLDRSFHHSTMAKLKDSEKRGRPDLVHVAMLSVTGTPLYLEGKVKLWVHTCQDMVLEVEEKTRIPKSYFRFRGLVEKALAEGSGGELIRIHRMGISELLKRTSSSEVYALSVQGKPYAPEELGRDIASGARPAVMVGGFPHGHFTDGTVSEADELVTINPKPLEAHVVAARLLYDVERASGD